MLLSLDPGGGAVIGIQFDHDFVRVAIADLSLTILAEGVIDSDVDHDAEAGLDAAAELVERPARPTPVSTVDRVIGAGVALSGPVDRETGLRQLGDDPAGLGRDRRRARGCSERLGVPSRGRKRREPRRARRIGARCGPGRERDGVRDAVVGHRRRTDPRAAGCTAARAAIAGEIGHVSVDDNGHMCRCGNRGCLETMVGAAALTELLRRSHGEHITSSGWSRWPARAIRAAGA